MEVWIYGVRPVEELFRRRPERVRELLLARQDRALGRLEVAARERGIPVRLVRPEEVERAARTLDHQGVAAQAPLPEYLDFEGLLARLGQLDAARVLVLDCIQDPQNLGALLRAADGAGVSGVVIPRDRAAGLSPAVLSASAGAAEWVPVSRVVNLQRAMEAFKEAGFWLVAADPEAEKDYRAEAYPPRVGLVIGAEGAGLRPLVRKACDLAVRIPLLGRVASLNAATAAAVVLFEMAAQAGEAKKVPSR